MEKCSKKRIWIALSFAAALILTNLCTGICVWLRLRSFEECPLTPLTQQELFAQYAPSVCEINTASETGTGFLAGIKPAPDGGRELFIATNLHVVDTFVASPQTISLSLKFYGMDVDAYHDTEIAVAGYDTYHDVAVLCVRDKLPQKERINIAAAFNYSPLPAEQLMLIGNMSGDGIAAFTHASAAVSNTDAAVYFPTKDRFEPLMGISVDVNGGCSGGPVLDMFGRLVGIGKAQEFSGGYPVAGASYAVPAAIAIPLIEKAVAVNDGREIHKIAATLKIADTLDLTEMSLILQKRDGKLIVERDSKPYAVEGGEFRVGDVVESIGGAGGDGLSFVRVLGAVLQYANESSDAVPDALQARYTGRSLTVCVLRGTERITITFTNKKEIALSSV